MAVDSSGNSTLANSSGDIILDSTGDVILDSAGNNVMIRTGTTNRLDLFHSAGDFIIQSKTDGGDLIFRQVDGTETFRLTDGGDGEIKKNLSFKSDAAVVSFGEHSEVSLTHAHDKGLLLNSDRQLQFRDSDIHISSDADGYLSAQANTGVNLNIGGSDLVAMLSTNVNVTATTDSSSVSTGGLTVAGGLGVAKMVTGGSFTDGVATLTKGSLTGLVYAQSNTISDGTAIMDGGSLTSLVYTSSTTLTDGTSVIEGGSITSLRRVEIVNDGQIQFRDSDIHISSDADGYLNAQANTGVNLNIGGTDLVTVASTNVNVTATTDSSSVSTGGLTVAGGLGVAKMVTGGSFTDGVGTLTAGSLTGLRALTGNRIMLGTITDISNTNFQTADKAYTVNIDSSKGILFFDSDNTDGSSGYTTELIKSVHYDASNSSNPQNYQLGIRAVDKRDLHFYTNNADTYECLR